MVITEKECRNCLTSKHFGTDNICISDMKPYKDSVNMDDNADVEEWISMIQNIRCDRKYIVEEEESIESIPELFNDIEKSFYSFNSVNNTINDKKI